MFVFILGRINDLVTPLSLPLLRKYIYIDTYLYASIYLIPPSLPPHLGPQRERAHGVHDEVHPQHHHRVQGRVVSLWFGQVGSWFRSWLGHIYNICV